MGALEMGFACYLEWGKGKVWFGGAGGIRTPYLRDANATFSRVNYGPKPM
jgi:hypothetical protein